MFASVTRLFGRGPSGRPTRVPPVALDGGRESFVDILYGVGGTDTFHRSKYLSHYGSWSVYQRLASDKMMD